MKSTHFLILFVLTLCSSIVVISTPRPSTVMPPNDVTLGHPRVWTYQRIYPLLDGLFEDVATTSIKALQLDPNSANAGNVDALLNAFSAGVSFTQNLGSINNSAQQANTLIANTAALQNQLLATQAQLIQSALTAQQQVTAATTALAALNAATPPSSADQLATAKQVVDAATAQQTSITNQMTLIKGQLPAALTSVQTPTIPSGATQSGATPLAASSALPSFLTTSTPTGFSGTPSFPVSKQMDNQFSLLWERLSKVVNSLAQPDSIEGYQIDLVQLSVGIKPFGRKKQLLGVEYELTCPSKAGDPLVLDLFPSASAVNIVNTKYRENRVGLAAVLSWFTVGMNAAYNRDHIQMSQALGQSAYITGFGVGTGKFGWVFGRGLGEDTVTPGERTMFALVAAPKTCTKLTLNTRNERWFKENEEWFDSTLAKESSSPFTFDPTTGHEVPSTQIGQSSPGTQAGQTSPGTQPTETSPSAPPQASLSMSYSIAQYDSAAPKTVTVTVQTPHQIDQQQTISVNGNLLKRTRDNFGRAVTVTSGVNPASGLNETAKVETNSWLPSSANSFVMTLDPSTYGRRFPNIQIVSPSPNGSYSVSEAFGWNAVITISGGRFHCTSAASCGSELPALGYPTSTVKQLLVTHQHGKNELLLIQVLADRTANVSAPAGNSATPSVQFVSVDDQRTWGGDSIVLATFEDDHDQATYRLSCDASGSRLICKPPRDRNNFNTKFTVEVIDPDHPGSGATSSIIGWQSVSADEPGPVIWGMDAPLWKASLDGQWQLHLNVYLINFPQNGNVYLKASSGTSQAAVAPCTTWTQDQCKADLAISADKYSNLTDSMVLQFGDLPQTAATGNPPTALLRYLLLNAQPLVTGISDSQNAMTGRNLFFSKLRIGEKTADGKNVHAITCGADQTQCSGITLGDKDIGMMYFLFDDDKLPPVPAMQTKVNVTNLVQVYRAAPPPPVKLGPVPGAASTPPAHGGGAPPAPPPPQGPDTTSPVASQPTFNMSGPPSQQPQIQAVQ